MTFFQILTEHIFDFFKDAWRTPTISWIREELAYDTELKIDGRTYIINPTTSETSNGISVPKEEITGVICYNKDKQDVCASVSIFLIL